MAEMLLKKCGGMYAPFGDEAKQVARAMELGQIISVKVVNKAGTKRTLSQNSALHLWLQQVADTLNDAGLDMKTVLKEEVEIPWTMESAKNHLWRPIQVIMQDKESTTEADRKDYTEIYEVIMRHLQQKHGVSVPLWPDRFRMDLEKGR